MPELFDLKQLKIEYVPCHALASRFTDNFIRVGDLYVDHFDTVAKEGGYAAKRLVEDKGVSLFQGHTQRFGAHAENHSRRPDYSGYRKLLHVRQTGKLRILPNWQQGFSVIYLEPKSGRFQWYPVMISQGGYVWRGKEFRAIRELDHHPQKFMRFS